MASAILAEIMSNTPGATIISRARTARFSPASAMSVAPRICPDR